MTTSTPHHSRALPLPSTPRLLRGLRTALTGLDTQERPDLQHALDIMDDTLSHLLLREDLAPYIAIYADMLALCREARKQLASDHDELAQQLDSLLAVLPETVAPEWGFDYIQTAIGQALRCLSLAVSHGASADYCRRALAAEQAFYGANYRQAPSESEVIPPQINRDAFESYLMARFPGRYQGLAAFQRLVGGFQKETILVDAQRNDGSIEAMVIRAEKHDRFVRLTASEITEEYAIVKLAWQHGVAVAEPLWLEDDSRQLGWRFMVSRRARGRNTGDSQGTSTAFSETLSRSFVEALAAIHNLPQDSPLQESTLGQWLAYPQLAANTLQEIRSWRHQIWMAQAPASPAFNRIFDWLENNVPRDDAPICVLHNDYGPHNILVEGDQVSAVLDWEVARIGDPAEDLSFFLQCCGQAVDRDRVLSLYQEISGQIVSEYRLRYFDVLSCAKVLMSGLSASTMYQKTDPALLDWIQMPTLWFGMYLPQVEEKIAVAEAAQ